MKKESPSRRSKILLLVGMLALSVQGISQNPSTQVFTDWSTVSGTQNDFQRTIVRSKSFAGATYYYLCGATLNSSGNYDMLVEKKNASGVVLWSQTYNGAGNGNDYAADVQIDNVGNVYICGTYYKNSTDSNNAIVIKYNTAGTHKWTQTFNGAGSRHDGLAAVQVAGNAVVTVGTTWKNSTNKFDYLAIRYDSSGNQIWSQTWDHNNLNDVAVNLWNNGTKVYIAGGAQSAVTTYKYGVVNVKASDGSVQGSTVTGGTAFGFDQLTDIQMDQSGFIYLTGGVINTGTVYDIKTVKLDTALNIIWSATYASSGAYNDVGTGLAIDQVGNVIVTGYRTSSTSGQDYVTVKYSSAGTQRWAVTWDGGLNLQDSATAIVVNPTDTNKIYVTGSSWNGTSKDYWTLKYDGAGNLKWDIGFNNTYNTDDRATSIALDTLGNVIVAGQNKLAWNNHTYTTVKYIEKSTLLADDTIPHVSSSFVFIENRGQLLGTDSATHAEVKYYTTHCSPNVYFMDTAVSYVIWKRDTAMTSPNDTAVRVDMKFNNANSDLRIRPMDKRTEYSNFFYPHIPNGRSNVPSFNQLVMFNVWNNVDIVYGSNLKGMKYYFVCKPVGGGGSAYQIDLKYSGVDSVKINGSGQLVIYTKLGTIVQPKAAAWQLDANGNYQSLGWQPSYTLLATNEVGFTSFGTYNTAQPLIIAVDWGNVFSTPNQNNLWWSTYWGDQGGDYLMDVEADANGNVYYGGYSSASNWPIGTGQSSIFTYQGSNDIVLIKLDTACGPIWTNYFGGTGNDQGYGVSVDQSRSVVICGQSRSWGIGRIPIITPTGAYQDTVNDGNNLDAFFARFDSTGQALQWSTYYGGVGASSSTYEIFNECVVDAFGNYFFVGRGCDAQTPTFPKGGAYNNSTNGEGIVAKFTFTGARDWITRFPGSIEDVRLDGQQNIYITGQARDSLLPIKNKGGGVYSAPADTTGLDAFITEFEPSKDSIIWSTYYGGAGTDIAKALAIDDSHNAVYIVGWTRSDTAYAVPFPTVDYDVTWTGDFLGMFSSTVTLPNSPIPVSDAFMVRFNQNDGAPKWGTYFGGHNEDMAWSAVCDSSGYLYVGGTTKSGTTFSALNERIDFPVWGSPGYYVKSDITGWENVDSDGWIATFTPNMQLIWTTYYGDGLQANLYGSGNNITGLAIDSAEHLYLSGYSSSGYNAPALPPVQYSTVLFTDYYQPTPILNSGDAVAARFGIGANTVLGIGGQPSLVVNGNLNVFPNPSSSSITIVADSILENAAEIVIYNMLGEVVYRQAVDVFGSRLIVQVDISTFANGVYTVGVTSGVSQSTRRFIKTE